MKLNKTLTVTGVFRPGQPDQIFHDYNARLNRMQSLAFQIGELLIGQPSGTIAHISSEAQICVVTFQGKLETVFLEHYEATRPDDEVWWYCITRQKYQDCDWGGEEKLEELSDKLSAWLANPAYVKDPAADRVQSLAKDLEQWIVDYEKEQLANSGKE